MPRSGIVPALVTASWSAPLRARITPFTAARTSLPGDDGTGCEQFKTDTLAYLRAHPEISTIFVSGNTGGPPAGDPLSFTREQWEAAYRSLVLTPMALVERAVPAMRERGWGRIVNVSSNAVREPIPYLMLSNAHRSATLAAFKTLARHLAGDGITLNTVLAGMIATDRLIELAGGSREAIEASAREQVPAGRLGRVEEFAAAAAFLCSDAASYITGAALAVDGGLLRSV